MEVNDKDDCVNLQKLRSNQILDFWYSSVGIGGRLQQMDNDYADCLYAKLGYVDNPREDVKNECKKLYPEAHDDWTDGVNS